MGEYSIETKNRFQLALEDDDVDVYDILKEEEAKCETKKKLKDSTSTTKNVKKDVKDEKKDKSKRPSQKFENSNTSSKNFSHNKTTAVTGNENRPPRMRQNQDVQKADDFEKPPASQEQQSGGFGGRGPRRGGSAGFRGGRGGGSRGGPRRFDRHSGSDRTGKKPIEKKEGFGSHNWGGEIEAQLDSSVQEGENQPDSGEKVTTGNEEDPTINAEEAGADGEAAPAQEPQVQEMTLDEWKAAQAGSRTKQQFNVRRAGEGEDPKQWQKTVALEPRKRAESTESYEEEEDDEGHDKVEDTRSTLNKLNIQIKFSSDNPRGGPVGRGGGRGRGFGRGPPRGGGGYDGRPPRRGRGGGFGGGYSTRGNRQEKSAPIVDNEIEFPSLGSR